MIKGYSEGKWREMVEGNNVREMMEGNGGGKLREIM
jgi:hypothetical protein